LLVCRNICRPDARLPSGEELGRAGGIFGERGLAFSREEKNHLNFINHYCYQ